jgi:hypothetical protein
MTMTLPLLVMTLPLSTTILPSLMTRPLSDLLSSLEAVLIVFDEI